MDAPSFAIAPPIVAMAVAKYGPAALAAFKALFGGKKDINWNQLQSWLGTLHAEGSVSPQDIAASELTRSKLTASAERTGQGLAYDANRRMAQRGIADAPAAEATLSRVAQQVARARQAAGETSQEQLYNAWLGNKRFEQEKLLGLARARLGDAGTARDRAMLERSTAFNSLLDYVPTLIPGAKTPAGGTPSTTPPPTGPNPDPKDDPNPVPGEDVPINGATTGMMRGAPVPVSRIARLRNPRRFNPATGRFDGIGGGRTASLGRSAYAAPAGYRA